MTNKEKYTKEIVEIACKGHDFGVDKNTNEVVDCRGTPCPTCLFLKMDNCYKARRQWAESEYIEKPVISKRDRAFLEYLKEEYKYIARDGDGHLFAYSVKPEIYYYFDGWSSSGIYYARVSHYFDVDFPMVKLSDSEPWLIEDLKKLEVVEEYE